MTNMRCAVQYQKVRQRADQKFSLKNLMDYQLWLAKGSFLGNENGRENKEYDGYESY